MRRVLGLVELGVVGAVLAAVLHAHPADGFGTMLFTDRELVRALHWPGHDAALGAELTGAAGARVPGFLLPALFGVPTALGLGPVGVYGLVRLLLAAGLVGLYVGLRRVAGPAGALAALALTAVSPALHGTVAVLYNPAFAPAFAGLAAGSLARLVHDRDARHLPGLVAAVALGAQVHLAILVVAAAAVPAVVVTLVGRPWRAGLVRAAAVLAVLEAPYVVSELVTGGANTRAWLGQPRGGPSPFGADSGLDDVVRWLVAPFAGSTVGLAAGLGLGGVLLGSPLGLRRPESRDAARTAAWLTGTAALGAVLLAQGTALAIHDRYVLPLVPVVAAAVGVAVRTVASLGPWPLRAVGPLGAGAALAVLAVGLPPRPEGLPGYPLRLAQLDALRAVDGSTLGEVAGRTVWAHAEAPLGDDWPTNVTIDHLLAPDGGYPGAAAPPCALVVQELRGSSRAGLSDLELVRGFVPSAGEATRVIDAHDLPGGARLVRYDPGEAWCPTTMSNRYVDLPGEAALRAALADRPTGEVLADTVDGAARFRVALPGSSDATRIDVEVVVDARADGVRVRFASPELRGWCDTWARSTSRVARVRLELAAGGEVVTIPLSPGPLGGHDPAPPLRVTAPPLAPGSWTATLGLDVLPAPYPGFTDPTPPRPERVGLGTLTPRGATGPGPSRPTDPPGPPPTAP